MDRELIDIAPAHILQKLLQRGSNLLPFGQCYNICLSYISRYEQDQVFQKDCFHESKLVESQPIKQAVGM